MKSQLNFEGWKQALLSHKSTIEQAIHNLNATALQLVLVVNDRGRFIGTISDGDIRRGLLKGFSLSSPIEDLINLSPLTVDDAASREEIINLMVSNKIHQIPLVDKDGFPKGLYLWDLIARRPRLKNLMVIMAGGFGTRLHPYTENCPKPMVLIGGKPMLEHIISKAKAEGFGEFIIAVHHLSHQIETYFGNGEEFDVKIKYLREVVPMGTAGALSLIDQIPNEPIVITNGDVITDIKYADFLEFHIENNAVATMAIREHEWQNPFGVVNICGTEIVGFEEKPITRSYINAGIYAISPESLKFLPKGSSCDMPAFLMNLRNQSKSIAAYPMHESWIDVGRPSDLIIANDLYK